MVEISVAYSELSKLTAEDHPGTALEYAQEGDNTQSSREMAAKADSLFAYLGTRGMYIYLHEGQPDQVRPMPAADKIEATFLTYAVPSSSEPAQVNRYPLRHLRDLRQPKITPVGAALWYQRDPRISSQAVFSTALRPKIDRQPSLPKNPVLTNYEETVVTYAHKDMISLHGLDPETLDEVAYSSLEASRAPMYLNGAPYESILGGVILSRSEDHDTTRGVVLATSNVYASKAVLSSLSLGAQPNSFRELTRSSEGQATLANIVSTRVVAIAMMRSGMVKSDKVEAST